MKAVKQKLTLAQPATYQIQVPGHLDESWSEWAGGMKITVESGDDGPTTTLTGVVADQAALQGLLRRLFPGLAVDFGQLGRARQKIKLWI